MKTLMLILAGLTVASLVRAETYPAAEKFSKTYPVTPQAELSLSNVNGSIEIIAWDKDEISVEAEKRAVDSDDLARIHIVIDASPTHLEIKTEHERIWWIFGEAKGSVHYTLHVPSTLALCRIRGVNSGITIDEARGQIDAHTVNGNVHVKGITSAANLHSVNGDIEVTLALGDTDHDVTAKTVNGNCRFSLPSAIAATIRGNTVNGNVKCALPLADMETGRHSLTGRIGAGDKGKIEASTVNGNVAFNTL